MKKLRYGIIGTGCQGQNHIENVMRLPDVEIVALADPYAPNLDSARALCLPEVLAYVDYRDLLENPTIDAVILATPNHTHSEVIESCVAAKKHIYAEKPLASSPQAATRIVRLVEGYEKTFWVGLQYRYMPTVARVRREVESGRCGAIKMLTIREHRPPFLHKVGAWNRFSAQSGGTLVEKCCHFFDLFNLFAAAKPLRVYASGASDVNHKDEEYNGVRPDIIDNAFVLIDYQNGVRALLEECMFHRDAPTHPNMFISAIGDQGYVQATMPPYEVVSEDFVSGQSDRLEIFDSPQSGARHFGADGRVHRAFADCLLHGGTPETNARNAAMSVYIGAAAELSIREKRPVLIEEVEAR